MTAGFTVLHATIDEACLGEEVIITCATTAYSIRWQFSLMDRTLQPVARVFQRSDSVQKSYNINTNALQFHLELTANSMGILNTTLLIRATAALDQALIQCEGTTTKYYTFRIARMFQKFYILNIVIRCHGTFH